MGSEQLVFRSVAVGGFNKQDVIAYIQSLARNQSEQLGQLRTELAAERAAREAAEGQLAAVPQQGPSEEAARTIGALEARLDESARECAALRARLHEAEQRVEAYQAKANDLEAEARNRAQQAAAAAAAKLQAECDDMLARIQAQYALLRGNIEATVSHAAGELDRAQNALNSAMAAFHVRPGEPGDAGLA